jgi:hypothetical protein
MIGSPAQHLLQKRSSNAPSGADRAEGSVDEDNAGKLAGWLDPAGTASGLAHTLRERWVHRTR